MLLKLSRTLVRTSSGGLRESLRLGGELSLVREFGANVTILVGPFSMSSPGSDEGRELGTRYRLPIRSDDMGRIRRVVVNRITFTKPDSRYTEALKQGESRFD